MNLDLSSVQYVVFDEADRLFELGFETALSELLARLPAARQTLLFSATLPKSLVEFARAGLRDPKLVRLDAESKLSADLRMAFFAVKQAEKDAALLTLLRDVIRVPLGAPDAADGGDDGAKGKGKGKGKGKARAPADAQMAGAHQALVFAATKHHVEYLQTLLSAAGYAVAHLYGALDQTARSFQMDAFRRGRAAVLVVTDVAARGIDIPVLAHVVNYDFPAGARVFVHRVGRTARAGRPGWAWSLLATQDIPLLLDLQLFLGRPLAHTLPPAAARTDAAYTANLVLGTFPRDALDAEVEYLRALDAANGSLQTLRAVMRKGHALYERTRAHATPAAHRRAKALAADPAWALGGAVGDAGVHPALRHAAGPAPAPTSGAPAETAEDVAARAKLLRAVGAFRPAETVFELGTKGNAATENSALMKARNVALGKARRRAEAAAADAGARAGGAEDPADGAAPEEAEEVEMADEADIEVGLGRGPGVALLTAFSGCIRDGGRVEREEAQACARVVPGRGLLHVALPEGRRDGQGVRASAPRHSRRH
jgi:ATP-dependent RNA helicase DDX54/DBP10